MRSGSPRQASSKPVTSAAKMTLTATAMRKPASMARCRIAIRVTMMLVANSASAANASTLPSAVVPLTVDPAASCRRRPDVEAATVAGLLELRSHARAGRRIGAAGRHRAHVPESAGRGNVLPHAAASRVPRRRDVAVLVCGVAVPRAAAVRRDPGVPVAVLPALVHLRQCEGRHPRGPRPHRQARGHARVPDDRACVDPRHPGRALRRARRLGDVFHRRRRGAGPRREDRARLAGQHSRAANRCDADACRDARRGRDRRAAHCADAVDVSHGQPERAPAVRRLRTSRAAVLPRHAHLPDHAHGCDPPRRVREEPLDRAVAVQGVRRGATAHVRRPLRHRRAEGHAAMAHRARGGGARAHGRRLLAVRLRPQPRDARDVPALSPRAGPVEAPSRPRGALRTRDAGVVQDLKRRLRRRTPALQPFVPAAMLAPAQRGEARMTSRAVGRMAPRMGQPTLRARLAAAERRAREVEERYALATSAALEGIYEWDVGAGKLLLTERAKAFFALAGDDLTPAAWNAKIHADDYPGYRAAIVRHFKGLAPHLEHEYRILDADGGYRWILDRGVGVRDASGRITKLVGALSDVTQRKRAEIALTRARDEAQEALEQQTAISEILRVMSRSPTDAQPVFDLLAQRAGRLCKAPVAVVSRFDGKRIDLAAVDGMNPEAVTMVRGLFPLAFDSESMTARIVRSAGVVHVADVMSDRTYALKDFARAA